MITEVLAYTDAEIGLRFEAMVSTKVWRPSGMPPLAPFIPMGLLDTISGGLWQRGSSRWHSTWRQRP